MQVVGIVEQDEQGRLQGSGQAGQWKDRRETRMDTERVEVVQWWTRPECRMPYTLRTLRFYRDINHFGGFAIRVSKGQL